MSTFPDQEVDLEAIAEIEEEVAEVVKEEDVETSSINNHPGTSIETTTQFNTIENQEMREIVSVDQFQEATMTSM